MSEGPVKRKGQFVQITEKGKWVIEETNKYPEHERVEAFTAICENRYEEWQHEREAILNAKTIG